MRYNEGKVLENTVNTFTEYAHKGVYLAQNFHIVVYFCLSSRLYC